MQQLCGNLADYNTYTEVSCNKVGNQIIAKKSTLGLTDVLAMAGLSILSSCDCTKSSFNRALILLTAANFAPTTTIDTTWMAASISITFNKQMPDTVSSVCGSADGITKCGLRTIIFTDKMTGKLVNWPFNGFTWDAGFWVLTLNPAQAAATCVLTATLQLINYPTVTYSQDITAIVKQPPPPDLFQPYPIVIATMTLNATISQEAYLQLPPLNASYSYAVTSKQKFEASVDGNYLLKVLSINETDVGI